MFTPTKCHVSHVTYQESCVTCHVSHVTFHNIIFLLFNYFLFGQKAYANRLRVWYQWGLPRLVSMIFHKTSIIYMINIAFTWYFLCYLYFAHAKLQIWHQKNGGKIRTKIRFRRTHGTRYLQVGPLINP